jgi:hypothetical protein
MASGQVFHYFLLLGYFLAILFILSLSWDIDAIIGRQSLRTQLTIRVVIQPSHLLYRISSTSLGTNIFEGENQQRKPRSKFHRSDRKLLLTAHLKPPRILG